MNELERFRVEWRRELQKIIQKDQKKLKLGKFKSEADNSLNAESSRAVSRQSVELESTISLPSASGPSLLTLGKDDDFKNLRFDDDNSVDQELADEAYSLSGLSQSGNSASNGADLEEYYPFKILTQFLNEAPKKFKPRKSKGDGVNPPESSYKKRKYFESQLRISSQKNQTEFETGATKVQSDIQAKKNVLDIFIADLDEINEIPFFDTTLPREVAIKIFQHLDMKSLCSCSQVSHSWRSLADDELLWFRIFQEFGQDTDPAVFEGEGWKNKVRQHVQEKRILTANWKERKGKPYNLNFARGGVLCAVHACGPNIVAGYTSCNVRLWDTKSGDVCTFNASNTALVLDESAEELGRIQNEIKQVVTTSYVTAASFRHGFVDVWHNEGGTDPVYTCSFHNPEISSLAVCDVGSRCSLVAASQGTRVQVSCVSQDDAKCLSDIDLNTTVTQLDWFDPNNHLSLSHLLITSHNSVNLRAVDASSSWRPQQQSSDITEIHNVIWAPITAVGSRASTNEIAVGFTLYGPTSQVKVNIYDAWKNHLKITLTGHTWLVSCIHMPGCLTDQLVTGSGDRKIRLYDCRIGPTATTTFVGHAAKITVVEMDDWKVVSGDEGGFVCVWDQRMCRKLWDVHNRHPVQYCHFDDRLLIIGNVPYLKFPETDEFESVSSLRYRGTVQVYDFLANQQTEGIPDICLSSYNEPEAYDYNIGLAVPYDTLT